MIVVPKVRVNGLTGEESFPYLKLADVVVVG
jgi:hypothetical protein